MGNINNKKNISVILGQAVVTMPYMLISLYFMSFLTDIIGITALAAGTFLLVVNIWDAVNDLMVGNMIDIAGSPKKIFNLAAIPYVISFILLFAVRQDNTFWIVFLYLSGIIFYFAMTGVDISFMTIILQSSKDEKELTKMHTIRGTTALVCVVVITTVALPVIEAFGVGKKDGFLYFAVLLAAFVAVLLFIYSKIMSKQTLFRDENTEKKKIPLKKYFAALNGNYLWILVVLTTVLMWVGNAGKSQTLLYYVKYNFEEQYFPLLTLTGYIASLVFCLSAPLFCKWFGVVKTIIGGFALSILGFVIMLVSNDSLLLLVIGNIIVGAFLMLPVTLNFVLVPDAAQMAQRKTGENISGFVQASLNFSQKIGTALGGMVSGAILSWGGYRANEIQDEKSLLSISICVIGVSVICNIICMFMMLLYNKKKKEMSGSVPAHKSEKFS